jgi:hypothetical protein
VEGEPKALDQLEHQLVWIFGSPRTGSSWLLQLLAETGEVVPIDETYLPLHLVPTGHTVPNGEFFQFGTRANDPNFFFAKPYLPRLRPELRHLMLSGLHDQVEHLGAEHINRWVVIKEPNGSHGADTTISLLPQSRVLFLLRDGRDVIDSLVDALLGENSWWRQSEQHIANKVTQQRLAFVRQHSTLWLHRTNAVQRAFALVPEEQRFFLRYETLLRETRAEFERLLRWLTIQLEPERVSAIVDKHSFSAIPVDERGSGKRARAAQPGLWRTNLSPEEQEVMHGIMGPKLAELGYLADQTLETQAS